MFSHVSIRFVDKVELEMPNTTRRALTTVCNMLIRGNMKQAEYLLKVDAIPALCNLLNAGNEEVHSLPIFIIVVSSNNILCA